MILPTTQTDGTTIKFPKALIGVSSAEMDRVAGPDHKKTTAFTPEEKKIYGAVRWVLWMARGAGGNPPASGGERTTSKKKAGGEGVNNGEVGIVTPQLKKEIEKDKTMLQALKAKPSRGFDVPDEEDCKEHKELLKRIDNPTFMVLAKFGNADERCRLISDPDGLVRLLAVDERFDNKGLVGIITWQQAFMAVFYGSIVIPHEILGEIQEMPALEAVE